MGASKGVEITGETHVLQGDFHPESAFTIKSKQGFIYDPEKLKTKNLLKLIFQEAVSLSQGVKTLGPLFFEGPSVEIGKDLEATHTEAQTPFLKITGLSLSTSLKASGKVEIISSTFTSDHNLEVAGDFNLKTAGSVVLKGSILGHQAVSISGKSVSAEKEIFSHKILKVESPGQISFKERVVGVESLTLQVGGGLSYKDSGSTLTPQTSGLQTGGVFEIISTLPQLYFKSPLSLFGLFVFKGPQAYNLSTLKASKGLVFLTPFVEAGFGLVNRGKLMSEDGSLYVEGNTTHYPEGEIYTSQQAHFKGHLNYFQGPLTVKEHLRIHTLHKWGLSYSPPVFKDCPSVTFAFDMDKQLNQPLESPETKLTLEGPSITVTKPFIVKEIKGDTPKLSFVLQEDFTLTPSVQTAGDFLIQAPSIIAQKKIQAEQVQMTSIKGDITLKDSVEGTDKVMLKTARKLTYPAEGLQTFGLLHLILPPYQHLEIPLKLPGQLRVETSVITNDTILEARKGIEILTSSYKEDLWNLYNLGKMISDEGDIILQGNFAQREKGEVRAAKTLKIKGSYHDFRGVLVEGQDGIEIEAKCPEKVANYSLHSFRTLGLLTLILQEGGTFWRPLEVEGGLEIDVLPHKTPQTVSFRADLTTGKNLRLKTPGHHVFIGSVSLPLTKIQSGGFFESIDAKTFDVIHGTVFSNNFFHLKTADEIILGRWLESQRTYKTSRGNAIGPEIKAPYIFFTPNGSSFISNEGMRLETQKLRENGDILVTNEHLEIVAHKESVFCGSLVEVWQGNATVQTPFFHQYISTIKHEGEGFASPYWISHQYAETRAPLFRVNGHIKFDVKKGKNQGGSILASGVIMGTNFIENLAAEFFFKSGIIYSYEKTPYDILHPARCSDLERRGWSNQNMLQLLHNEQWNKKHLKHSPKKMFDDYFTLGAPIEIESDSSYSILPQMEGSQGIAFTGTKQALVQGKIVGSKILIGFKEGLTVQTVGRSGSTQTYQPIMALSLDSLLSFGKSDSMGKMTSLVSMAYPLEEELKGMPRLILGPQGSEKLPFALPSFLEGRALLEAFQKNIGYIPLTPECPDYLSLHRKVIQNGAALAPYLKPFLENPKLLGLPGNASFEAVIEQGMRSLQKQSLPKEISLKLQEPVIFYGPQGKGNSQSLRSYVGTSPSYYDPHLREHVAQIKGKEVYLMGDEASLTHFDQARLVGNKGVVATGTLRLTKQVDCIRQEDKTYRYVPHPGGEAWVKQLELHGTHCENNLGEVKSEVLWEDFKTLSTTGVVQATILIEDVGQVLVRRAQHSWEESYTVETITKKKRWTGHAKKKKKTETHTIVRTEAYPEELSGFCEAGRVVRDPKEISLLFPDYEKVRVLESLRMHGSKFLVGPEGWSQEATQKIELLSLITTSLKDYSAGCRGMSKKGMIPYYEVVPSEVISKGPIHILSHQDIEFWGPKIEGLQGTALIEARDITFRDTHFMQPQAPILFNQKRKIMERGGFKEIRLPTTIKMPGEVILRASGGIVGDRPDVSSTLICESDVIDLTRPQVREEMYEKCVGYRARGVQALAMIAGLAAGLLSMGTATPTVMAGFLSVAETSVLGTIGSVAVGCVAGQTASSLVMHSGNLKDVGKDLTSSHFAKSLIINMASAGTIHELSGPLKLPTQPKGWAQHLKVNGVRAMVSTPLHIAIEGCKPPEALVSGVTSCVAHTVGGVMANHLGDLYGQGKLSYVLHKGGHFGGHVLLTLGLSGGDVQEAFGAGLSALGAEMIGESLPETLSLQTRGTLAKIGGSLTSLLTNTDPSLSIFAASNAIDHNFLSPQEEDYLKKQQEEEELDQILAYLSPTTQAGRALLLESSSPDFYLTPEERYVHDRHQTLMTDWSDITDDFGGSYSTFGDLMEAYQVSEEPSLRDLDQRGRGRAREFIYPHRRSTSPPRLKETVFEGARTSAKETMIRITPDVVKEILPYLVQGTKEGFIFVGDHVPGAKMMGQKCLTLLEGVDVTLDVMPTALRRTARILGFPQNWAQNIGDMAHLLQDIGLIVLPMMTTIRAERIVAETVEMSQLKGITLTLEYKPEMNLRDFNRKLHILKTAAERDKLYSKIPHGIPSQERQALTRVYRKELQRRINSFYGDNPQARHSALEKLRKADIDHMIDLQLGGLNIKKNLKTLDAFTNQEIGRQVYQQLVKNGDYPIIKVVENFK